MKPYNRVVKEKKEKCPEISLPEFESQWNASSSYLDLAKFFLCSPSLSFLTWKKEVITNHTYF